MIWIASLYLDKDEIHKAYEANADFIEIQIVNEIRPITVYLQLTNCFITQAKMIKQIHGAANK